MEDGEEQLRSLPCIPVERSVLEDDKSSRLSLIDEFAVELEVDDAGDASLLGNGDGQLSVGENEVAPDGASCETSSQLRAQLIEQPNSPRAGTILDSASLLIEVALTTWSAPSFSNRT